MAREITLAVQSRNLLQYNELDRAVGVGENLFDLEGVEFRHAAACDQRQRTAKQPIEKKSMHEGASDDKPGARNHCSCTPDFRPLCLANTAHARAIPPRGGPLQEISALVFSLAALSFAHEPSYLRESPRCPGLRTDPGSDNTAGERAVCRQPAMGAACAAS